MKSRDETKLPHRTAYIRYADDWIVMGTGSRKRAEIKKEEIKQFLKNELKLKLSEEKTKITDLRKENIKFLGFEAFYIKGKKRIKGTYGRRRRTTGQRITIGIDMRKVLERLKNKGFLNADGTGKAKNPWTVKSDYEIIENFNWLTQGIIGYYAQGVKRNRGIDRIRLILDVSCKKTIAKKHKISSLQVMKKYGDPLIATIHKDQNKKVMVQMGREESKKYYEKLREQKRGTETEPIMKSYVNWRTALKLKGHCVICGSEENVEMHHLKKIRDIKPEGFKKVMISLNRKQVSVCRACHKSIHRGEYDGKKLAEFHDPKLAAI